MSLIKNRLYLQKKVDNQGVTKLKEKTTLNSVRSYLFFSNREQLSNVFFLNYRFFQTTKLLHYFRHQETFVINNGHIQCRPLTL